MRPVIFGASDQVAGVDALSECVPWTWSDEVVNWPDVQADAPHRWPDGRESEKLGELRPSKRSTSKYTKPPPPAPRRSVDGQVARQFWDQVARLGEEVALEVLLPAADDVEVAGPGGRERTNRPGTGAAIGVEHPVAGA